MGSIRLEKPALAADFVVWPILPEKKLKEVQIICIILVSFKALEEKKKIKSSKFSLQS